MSKVYCTILRYLPAVPPGVVAKKIIVHWRASRHISVSDSILAALSFEEVSVERSLCPRRHPVPLNNWHSTKTKENSTGERYHQYLRATQPPISGLTRRRTTLTFHSGTIENCDSCCEVKKAATSRLSHIHHIVCSCLCTDYPC